MSEDTIKKALEIIKKIQDQGIADNEKLEAIKNKIETSHSITLEEKQYISDNFQKIKVEKNKTKPLKLKKSHYVAIGAGVTGLMIFVILVISSYLDKWSLIYQEIKLTFKIIILMSMRCIRNFWGILMI